MKELQLYMKNMTINTNEIIVDIGKFLTKEDIKETMDKVKKARELAKVLEKLNEVRLDLFRIEIAAVIRASELDINIKGVTKEESKMFQSIGNRPEEYQSLYGEVWTTSQVVWAYRRKVKIGEAKDRGRSFYKEQAAKNENHESFYYSLQDAMRIIIETASTQDKPFSTDDLYKSLIKSVKHENPETDIEAYSEGVKEICRNAMRSEKILTIGEKKAPAFVTVKTDSGDYIRVPFRLSNIDQLESMIEIREEQLKQNQAALNNLIKIKEDLESLTNDKKKKIEDILKEVVDSQ